MMGERTRKTGIDVVGDAPWGTHFCLFYQTKEDLIDILVPYFKAGLENNEFCMWVTSEPLDVEEAKRSLKGVVKNLDYSQWYTQSGRFEADKVLQGWIEKEDQAAQRGFEGLRLTGNTLWLEKRDWRKFTEYEARIDNVIGQYRILALCAYSLDTCGASEIMDVVSNHQFALIRREGKWEIVESSARKRAEEEIRGLAKFPSQNPNPVLRVARDGTLLYANEASLPLLDIRGCQEGQPLPDDWRKLTLDVLTSGVSTDAEVEVEDRMLSLTFAPVVETDYVNVYGLDITGRVRAEGALSERVKELTCFYEVNRDMQEGLSVDELCLTAAHAIELPGKEPGRMQDQPSPHHQTLHSPHPAGVSAAFAVNRTIERGTAPQAGKGS